MKQLLKSIWDCIDDLLYIGLCEPSTVERLVEVSNKYNVKELSAKIKHLTEFDDMYPLGTDVAITIEGTGVEKKGRPMKIYYKEVLWSYSSVFDVGPAPVMRATDYAGLTTPSGEWEDRSEQYRQFKAKRKELDYQRLTEITKYLKQNLPDVEIKSTKIIEVN